METSEVDIMCVFDGPLREWVTNTVAQGLADAKPKLRVDLANLEVRYTEILPKLIEMHKSGVLFTETRAYAVHTLYYCCVGGQQGTATEQPPPVGALNRTDVEESAPRTCELDKLFEIGYKLLTSMPKDEALIICGHNLAGESLEYLAGKLAISIHSTRILHKLATSRLKDDYQIETACREHYQARKAV